MRWARVGQNLESIGVDGLEDVRLHGEDHEAGKTIAQVRFYRGEVPIVLALLERNTREVGFADNIGEYRVRETRQELVDIERHRSNLRDWLYRVGAACSCGSRVSPGIIRRGRRSVSDGAVSRRPQNYALGAKEHVARGCS